MAKNYKITWNKFIKIDLLNKYSNFKYFKWDNNNEYKILNN